MPCRATLRFTANACPVLPGDGFFDAAAEICIAQLMRFVSLAMIMQLPCFDNAFALLSQEVLVTAVTMTALVWHVNAAFYVLYIS